MKNANPSKMDQAVKRVEDRANGVTATVVNEEVGITVQTDNNMLGITSFDPKEFAEQVASGMLEATPQVVSLLENQAVTGTFEAIGSTEIGTGINAVDGDGTIFETKKTVGTIIILLDNGMRISMLRAAQLEMKMPKDRIGQRVKIARGPTNPHEGGKKQLTQYVVGFFK